MKVSILMAVYNAERWVQKSIDSVLAQSYTDWELICMDDGSTDCSLSVLRRNAANDSRIRVYSYSHCGNHTVYLNRGTQLATGEFLFPLDSDDWISSNLLLQLLRRQVETNADFVIPDMYRVDEQENELSSTVGYNGNRGIIVTGRQAVVYSLDWSIHTIGLIRKTIALAHPFDEDGFNVEVTSRQRLLSCNKVAFSEGIYYYLQSTQAITKHFGIRRFYYVVIDMKMMQFLSDNGFDKEVQLSYYVASLKRLIVTQILYYQHRKKLSIGDRIKAEHYLDNAYHYIINKEDTLEIARHLLSPKQNRVFGFRKQWAFKLYCYLRK